MTPALRKRHLRIWVILAFLLPIGFVSAFLEKPVNTEANASSSVYPTFERLLKDSEDEDFKVHLWAQTVPVLNDSSRQNSLALQLQIIIKKPLRFPSTQVYLSLDQNPEPIESKVLLGNLGPRGTYHFELSQIPEIPETFYIVLYDGIKKQPIKTITL